MYLVYERIRFRLVGICCIEDILIKQLGSYFDINRLFQNDTKDTGITEIKIGSTSLY